MSQQCAWSEAGAEAGAGADTGGAGAAAAAGLPSSRAVSCEGVGGRLKAAKLLAAAGRGKGVAVVVRTAPRKAARTAAAVTVVGAFPLELMTWSCDGLTRSKSTRTAG